MYFYILFDIKEKEEIAVDIAERHSYSGADKRYVLERDNYNCQICGLSRVYFNNLQPCLDEYLQLHIDHKVCE